MCVVIHQEQKKWWENVIFTIRVLSRLTALLTWAASLGWTSAVTCCNTYREYHAPLVFTLSCVHRFARPIITQVVFHIKCNHIQFSYYMDDVLLNFVVFCSTCNNIMHILPLPRCGLYSICAQDGCGQHRPCKIVLLTLVAPGGVTDLYLSWGINIEQARTVYHEICWTEYCDGL